MKTFFLILLTVTVVAVPSFAEYRSDGYSPALGSSGSSAGFNGGGGYSAPVTDGGAAAGWAPPESGSLVGWWLHDISEANATNGYYPTFTYGSVDGTQATANARAAWTNLTGGLLKFDGTDDWILLGTNADFNLTSQITIAAWVNGSFDSVAILTKWYSGVGTDNAYALIQAAGNYDFRVYESDDNEVTVTATRASGYHHVVATADGANLIIYVDGAAIATNSYDGTIKSRPVRNLVIGRLRSEDALYAYKTYPDDVMLWNKALTAVQVTDLYNNTGQNE